MELPRVDVFNVVIRWFTPGTFHIVPGDSADVKREKLANFMAHCHYLEKRVARSLEYQADASEDAASAMVGKAVRAVLQDEGRHVNYTIDAVHDLLAEKAATGGAGRSSAGGGEGEFAVFAHADEELPGGTRAADPAASAVAVSGVRGVHGRRGSDALERRRDHRRDAENAEKTWRCDFR